MQSGIFWFLACLLPAIGLAQDKPRDERPAPRPVTGAAAAQRNENVQVNRIDNDAIKEANLRVGGTIRLVPQPVVETRSYATELGRPAGDIAPLRASRPLSGYHGELYEFHQNSVFNARTFFQSGPVQPARQNRYGLRFLAPARGIGDFTGSFEQRKIRGMVNGNVQVPLADERTPRTTDPARGAIIERFLGAYPNREPNRPDFDPRALNLNAAQLIDELDGSLRLDRAIGSRDRITLLHAISRQRVNAFQFVAGQNPNMNIHSTRSRLSWQREASPVTEILGGFAFQRTMSALVPEPNAVGPRVRFGYQIQELGPDSQFPINRAINTFRGGMHVNRRLAGGRHTLTFGGEVTRVQLNGEEVRNSRGVFIFSNNFGRTAIENLLVGTPSLYEVNLGELNRGFRNWLADGWIADQWRVSPGLQIYLGVRYNLVSRPAEVRGLDTLPYACDCNNFAPRVSLAWQMPGAWVLRSSYSIAFSEIQPVTYQQIRFNLPHSRYVQVQNPDLVNPLRNVDLTSAGARSVPTIFSPEMVSPYTHHYNALFERRTGRAGMVRLGYVGSRSIKLLNSFIENRARIVPGIPQTLATVDQRRPDPRYYEMYRLVNGGIGYLDAAQASWEGAQVGGLTWGFTYTFSKAIDEGVDYTATAANGDLLRGRSQYEDDAFRDRKGVSNFHSPHAAVMYYAYDLPFRAPGRLGLITNGWQMSGATLLKNGMPFTLYVGSDAPGFGNVDGGPSDRPNVLDPSVLGSSLRHPNESEAILSRDKFTFLRVGEPRGNIGRNTFRRDGIVNFNASVSKQWTFGQNGHLTSLVFRAEAVNLANHPQFDEPQRNLTAPQFGRITNTLNDGRVLQFGLRLML
ncbi:MAG: hypothetical protein IPM24_08065 [Bryobacterales bacterium]|nr:hypothetical protein [Bryobacterales bacterium]